MQNSQIRIHSLKKLRLKTVFVGTIWKENKFYKWFSHTQYFGSPFLEVFEEKHQQRKNIITDKARLLLY